MKNWSKNGRGENELAKNTKNTSHKPNPGAKAWFLYKSHNLWTSLTRNLRRGETKEWMMENKRGEGDVGSLILFNRSITQSQFCPSIQ
jgi:hypothetical protein